MTAVFGEFLDWADAHITAAASFRGGLSYPAQCAVVHQVGRLVTVLGRYLADLPALDALGLARGADAAVQGPPAARLALDRAACILGPAAGAAAQNAHPVAAHLAAAADYLTAGRDLLETHFATDPARQQTSRSWWAPVITSEPVTAALLTDLAGHAQNLASCVTALALTRRVPSPTLTSALLTLRQAAPWLQLAAFSIRPLHRESPDAARSLLRAIPASTPPIRPPPGTGEPVPVLCDRIPVTAERLRHAAFTADTRWAPVTTSLSWRRDALAAAITSHASGLILSALVDRARQLGLQPSLAARLSAAAGQMTPAWTAWRAVTDHWDILTTGTYRGARLTPVAAEIGDLALRLGRLAYRNPTWTPARADASSLREPADLAPSPADLLAVLAAVHHAADAASRVATTDKHAAAAAEDRLYIPVRLLPDKYDIPHPYAFAPRKHADALLAAYDKAARAAATVAAALDDLAVALDAPSSLLAIARQAHATTRHRPRRHAEHQHATQPPVAAPPPGRTEHALHKLQIRDPALLLRAAVIDQAAHDLIDQATGIARGRDTLTDPACPVCQAIPRARRPVSPAPQIASQDLPHAPRAIQLANHPRNNAATAAAIHVEGPGMRGSRAARSAS